MKRRDLLKVSVAGATALAAPRIGHAAAASQINFAPQADLVSIDPVWTTADVTRNFSLAVFDTLYGYDAAYTPQPQMVDGATTSSDGKQWDLTLRDGLKFHDGEPVLAKDCVATINRWSKRNPFGDALMARTDELSAASDKVIRFRLKEPFPLLPSALAEVYCAIMPERIAKTDPYQQIPEVVGSGPFKYVASERIPGQRVAYEKNTAYIPRKTGEPSFNAGPKIVHVDRVVWNFIPDAATASAALTQKEIDWWEQPQLDLVPELKRNNDLILTVKDHTGEIGCLRFNSLLPPFDNPAIRRVVVEAIDQTEIMQGVAGSVPELIKTDVGIFVPGTPMASTAGVEITRGPKNYDKLKADLKAAGYKGEKVVILAAATFPTIFAAAQVAEDTLKKIGLNTDFQSLDWSTVVARRASQQPIEKGGWNIFYTYLGGFGNISPASNIAIRGTGTKANWFGWPTDAKMEELRDAWLAAPSVAAQKKISEAMQVQFWKSPPHAPLGMYFQPTAYQKYMQDIREGFPQFYGVKKVV